MKEIEKLHKKWRYEEWNYSGNILPWDDYVVYGINIVRPMRALEAELRQLITSHHL